MITLEKEGAFSHISPFTKSMLVPEYQAAFMSANNTEQTAQIQPGLAKTKHF